MAKKKQDVIIFENIETCHITIAESILRNILKDWHTKWNDKYEIKARKEERKGMFFSILRVDVSLWGIFFSVPFGNALLEAVVLVLSVSGIFTIIYIAYLWHKASIIKEEELNIEELIKTIEKRTD